MPQLPDWTSMRAPLPGLALAGVLVCLLGCEQPTPPVLRFNQAPKADAGSDLRAEVGAAVILDGDQSRDPEGGDLAYAWIQVSGPEAVGIQNASASQAVFWPRIPGEFGFRLTVTDGGGASSTDDVRATITGTPTGIGPAAGPPIADAGLDAAVRPGDSVVLDGAGSVDLDGGALTYSWIQVAGPSLVGILKADGARARVVPQDEGEYLFRLTVTDDEGTSAVDEVRIQVRSGPVEPDPRCGNVPPLADAGPDAEVLITHQVLLDGRQSTDADGEALRFAWIQVAGPSPVAIGSADAEVASVDPTEPGVYVFRVIVIDSSGATDTDEVRITVSALPAPAMGSIDVEGVFGALGDRGGEGGT